MSAPKTNAEYRAEWEQYQPPSRERCAWKSCCLRGQSSTYHTHDFNCAPGHDPYLFCHPFTLSEEAK